MRKFSKILENHNFEGRSTDMAEVIDGIIQNVEYAYEEKDDLYNRYIPENLPDDQEDDYINDLENGRMREFYKSDKIADYGELRQYLFETYGFNLDVDIYTIYVDCMWLKYLMNSMTRSVIKGANN